MRAWSEVVSNAISKRHQGANEGIAWRAWTPYLWLIGFAVLLRLALYVAANGLLYHGAAGHPDSVYYDMDARNLIARDGWLTGPYPDYVSLVALLYRVLGTSPVWPQALNMIASAGTVCFGYATVLYITKRPSAAALAGILLAINPYEAYLSTQILRDSLIIFSVALFVYLVVTRRPAVFAALALLLVAVLRYRLGVAAGGLALGYLLLSKQWRGRGRSRDGFGAFLVVAKLPRPVPCWRREGAGSASGKPDPRRRVPAVNVAGVL